MSFRGSTPNNYNQSRPRQSITLSGNKPRQAIQTINPNKENHQYTQIGNLYPMLQGWVIKARVVVKSDIKNFVNKQKGTPGQFFNIELVDSDEGKISGTFFNEACVKFYDRVEIGKVYEFSKASIRQNRYSNQQGNPYQIAFEDYSHIQEVDDDIKISSNSYNLKKIDDLFVIEVGSVIDVLGIVMENSQPQLMTLKTGEKKNKRSFHIYDPTEKIEATVWGSIAEKANLQKDDFVCLKSMKVSEYQGQKTLSSTPSTVVVQDPSQLMQIPQYSELYTWFELNKGSIVLEKSTQDRPAKPTKQLKTLQNVEQEASANSSNQSYKKFFEVRAYIMYFNNKNITFYVSCHCKKKLVQRGEHNTYFCQFCDKEVFDPQYRYILTTKISDHTGSLWVTLYDEQAESFLGVPCKDYQLMTDEDKKSFFMSHLFKEKRILIQTKMEEYNMNVRPRHGVIKFLDDDYLKETQDILEQLRE